MNKKVALVLAVAMLALVGEIRAANVTLDGAVEHQTIEGLGGHLDGPSDVLSSQFWSNMFVEVGVTTLYDYVPVGHDQWDSIELFPLLREARRYGLRNVNSSFNSTPTAWKDANDYLLPQHYTDWANDIVNYVGYVKANTGMDVSEIAAFNEPTIGTQGLYERCRITASEYINFLQLAGPIFRAQTPNVRIHVPVNWGITQSITYANTILADPSVLTYIDRLSTHCYGWDNGSSTADKWRIFAGIAQSYGKVTAHTETWHGGSNNPPPHPAGLMVARWIHEAFVDGNAVTFHWWDMYDKGSHRTQRGFVFSKDWPPGEFAIDGITKQGFVLRQFARWVRPGAIRVDSTSDDAAVLVSGYKHPVQNTATIVAINTDLSSKTVSFTINDLPVTSSMNACRTSATEDGFDLGTVTASAGSFTFDLPPESTTTFFAGTLNMPPHAVAAANPTTVQVDEIIGFDASGSGDPDGDTLTYSWDFGDNSQGTGVAPTHSYSAVGTYTVTLTVDDGRGETSADSLQIRVTGLNPVGCQGLAVLFHLDNDPAFGETSSLAHDFSQNGHDGSISNATFDPAGMFGGCYEFDGATSDINLGSTQTLDDLEPYTLSLWIKPRSAVGYLVAKENSGAAGSWRLGIDANGALTWYKVTGGGIMMVTSASGALQLDRWQHVALTWDGTVNASGVHIYVDGVETSYQTQTDGSGAVQSDGAYDLHLGSRVQFPEIFDGWMDEVAFWSRVLLSQEVADLAALGGPLLCLACASDADCDDNDVCNGLESCQSGACAGGTTLDCDDGNVCTTDSCDPLQGCQWANNTISCDDGDACTMDDVCSQAVCSGDPLDADGDGSVAEACGGGDCDDADAGVNPGVFEGPHDAGVCADGIDNNCDGLTDGEQATCLTCGTDSDCDDGNPCTTDACDPALGCQNASNDLPCNDGDDCTLNDRCRDGACTGESPDVDDDGFVNQVCGGTDCNDSDPAINPDAEDICDDGIDQDCDGDDEDCGRPESGCGCGGLQRFPAALSSQGCRPGSSQGRHSGSGYSLLVLLLLVGLLARRNP